MVETEGWEYSDGKSYVCSCLVAGIWKAGGIFPEGVEIEATEFTPKDVYQIKFFDENFVVPDQCKINDPDLPYCQIMGKFTMRLDNFNTVEPYSHMNERCPS